MGTWSHEATEREVSIVSKYRLVNVKHYKTTGRGSCLHCGRSAVVTAVRVRAEGGRRLEVRYCAEHFEIMDTVIRETRTV